MRILLATSLFVIMFSSKCLCSAVEVNSDENSTEKISSPEPLKSTDDYDVEHGGTYQSPNGLPPQKQCETVCGPGYDECTADCFRGHILKMGSCLARCSSTYCKTVCK